MKQVWHTVTAAKFYSLAELDPRSASAPCHRQPSPSPATQSASWGTHACQSDPHHTCAAPATLHSSTGVSLHPHQSPTQVQRSEIQPVHHFPCNAQWSSATARTRISSMLVSTLQQKYQQRPSTTAYFIKQWIYQDDDNECKMTNLFSFTTQSSYKMTKTVFWGVHLL